MGTRTETPDFPPDNKVLECDTKSEAKPGLADQPCAVTTQTSITDSHREEAGERPRNENKEEAD